MPALAAPYRYASIDDVKIHATMRAVDLDVALSTLPAGAALQLLEDYSREADTYLGKRRSVPIKVTPHATIKMYVAQRVALVLQRKFGELPGSDLSAEREALDKALQEWIWKTVDPNGFVLIPEENDKDGSPAPKAQTLGQASSSPYPAEWRRRSVY